MKRLLLVLAAAAALAVPAAAAAHPLGNFTINRFARVEVAGNQVFVRYVLDLAEIPTFEAQQRGVDARVYAARLARGIHPRDRKSTRLNSSHSLPSRMPSSA